MARIASGREEGHSTSLIPAETADGRQGHSLEEDLKQLSRTVATASLSLFCLGYNTAIVAGVQEGLKHDTSFGGVSGGLATGELASCALASAAVGALAGQVANMIGRRKTLLSAALLFFVTPLLTAAVPNFRLLLAARILSGFAIGLASVLTNLYISEVSPAVCRGRLGGWGPFIGTTGILVSYVVSSALDPLPNGAWRWQFGLASVPAFIQLLLHRNLPETPRWLLSNSRPDEAKAALKRLFPLAAEACLDEEIKRLEEDLDSARQTHPVRTLGLCQAPHRVPTIIGVSINVLQQVSGINVFIYFGPTILQQAGFGNYSMISTTVVSVIQLSATAVLIKYIDIIGRRPLALRGILGMLVGLALLAGGSIMRATGLATAITAWPSLLGMLIFRAAFSLSLGPLPYVMTSEFFAQEARASGVGLCWAMNWISNFGVSLSFPVMSEALPGDRGQALIFGIYAFFSAVAYVVVFCLLPETNGVRLDGAGRHPTATDEADSRAPEHGS
eukprot:TRINITY_DN35425_c0_g1_i1.p1 TRINITY_DN35425_c0_g1~~TRINITY_DN35425_c0_g1_i1.p1  ORF type:complete len:516 (+),score=67.37 TRINITY_DN35425_c0_g1_i1:37-1548(+)